MHMRLLTVVATFVTLLAAGASAAPKLDSVSIGEAQSLTAEAATVRSSLYKEVGAKEPGAGDFVSVTVFGGMPPPDRFTIYLVPAGAGLFRAEMVTQDRTFQGPTKPARRVTFDVSPEASRKIAALLANPALWKEPVGLAASCTDQPVVTLNAGWKGKKREAVRLALVCTPQDLTRTLIETALAQADKR